MNSIPFEQSAYLKAMVETSDAEIIAFIIKLSDCYQFTPVAAA